MIRNAILAALVASGCLQTKEEDFRVPTEVTRCRQILSDASREVAFCGGLCDYPAYCCSVERCKTTSIANWNRVRETCAEWGVEGSEILWPKPNGGVMAPECGPQHEEKD